MHTLDYKNSFIIIGKPIVLLDAKMWAILGEKIII